MRRPSAAVIALIVFALVDVGLSWAAISSTRASAVSSPAAGATALAAAPSAESSPSTATSTTHATAAVTTAAKKPHGGKVIVTAITHDRAWRAGTASMACSKDAKKANIAYTNDGGSNWTKVDVPMATVSGLSFKADSIIATGLDTSCDPVTYALRSTSDPSKTSTAAPWALDPTDSAMLKVAGKSVGKQPCTDGALDVAADSSSDATVLCRDGSIHGSTDGGGSWDKRGTVKGAVAIGTASSGDTVYVASRANCGLSVVDLSHASDTKAACVSGTSDIKGPVDLTIVGSTMWLTGASTTVTEPTSDLG